MSCQDSNSLCSSGEVCSGGVCQVPTYGIYGTVFIDTNENGVQDVGDNGFQGGYVEVSPGGGSSTSNLFGNYRVTGLTAGGNYTITFTVPGGYQATTPTSRNFPNLRSSQNAYFGIVRVDPPFVSPGLARILLRLTRGGK